MLYLGIDQHAKQLTIDLGDEAGDLVSHRRVSTRPTPLKRFLEQLQELSAAEGGYLAVVEVTGFNDYLLKLLMEYGCQKVMLVQPVSADKRKTDRRDARKLRELLWTNRHRFLEGRYIQGLRVVTPPTEAEAEDRQVTSLMKHLRKRRNQIINRLHTILKKHNLQHDMPTKHLTAVSSQRWLKRLTLGEIDNLERDLLLEELAQIDRHIEKINLTLCDQYSRSVSAHVVGSTPGLSVYASVAIASRLGSIRRFPNGDAMANFVGLTPSCRNSDSTIRRGGVTKLGSPFIRHLLCQALRHVLPKDPWLRRWYKRIKARRGVSVARVAVMRRLVTILYAMLRDQMPYVPGGPERYEKLLRMRDEQQLSFDDVNSLAHHPNV